MAILPRRMCLLFRFLLVLLLLSLAATVAAEDARYTRERQRMVSTQIEARGISDRATLRAVSRVPRHLFVREDYRSRAYADSPLPIGHGQTISQPYIVALMTQLAELQPGDRTLEIGTGSGYQAAVLAEITREVYTIEIVEPLYRWGAENLRNAGYDSVQVKNADGYWGWEEHAPFDAIVVTAAAASIPPPLIDQLADGGVMVIPVGSPFLTQTLTVVRRTGSDIRTRQMMPVRFVPFVRETD